MSDLRHGKQILCEVKWTRVECVCCNGYEDDSNVFKNPHNSSFKSCDVLLSLSPLQAKRRDLTSERGYLWLLPEWWGPVWFLPDKSDKENNFTDCDFEKFAEQAIHLQSYPYVDTEDRDVVTDLGLVRNYTQMNSIIMPLKEMKACTC